MRKLMLCGRATFVLTVGAALAGGLGVPVMEPKVVDAAIISNAASVDRAIVVDFGGRSCGLVQLYRPACNNSLRSADQNGWA